MKEYAEKQAVKEWAITRCVCDCCGEEASSLGSSPRWKTDSGWDGVGALQSYVYVGPELLEDDVDICSDCAQWLIDKIQTKALRRYPDTPNDE